jgi:hypothetical protein
MTSASTASDPAAMRAEHDDLAAKLATRRSVDLVRRGAYVGFAAFVGVGLSVKLAWDRWGTPRPGIPRKVFHGPPLFFFLAMAATIVLVVLAIRAFTRAVRLGREEDRLFARMRALRDALRLDP